MKDRKRIPKITLHRIYKIDKEIASGKYPNTRTLAEEQEVGTATISRDIEFMRDRMNAPIEYDYARKGYYYSEKTFRLSASFANAEDMLALGMTKTLLSLYQDTPIYAITRQLMENIIAPLEDNQNPHWYEDRILVPPVPSILFSPDVWKTVTDGLRLNRILKFEYRSTWTSGFHIRRVKPYQLLFDNGAWYLYGYSEERGGMRMFSLSRIRNINLEEETFIFPATADYRSRTDGSYFGAYSSEKKRRFRIAFFNDGAMRINERRWAADQRIKENQDGVILSFTSSQYGKVLELVLANGRDAQPLEPAELVRDWEENVRDMQKRIKAKKKVKDVI
ncbi:MAG: WYL domain-containing protein [Treponema sp.]|jgi:predicted DNA-binding transcriptional regulator YafY|nr:WYL domain-containing protein [Treponema sp.]